MSPLRALWVTLRVYAVGAAVLGSQLLRRLRGGFRKPALPRQPGRVAVVTGGTDGIGLETARQLAALGMRVVVAGNNADKGPEVVRRIQEETHNDHVHFLFLDLASLTSVRKFARDFLSMGLPLHVLVNNAGVMMGPRTPTEDGFERHVGVNFLGHFLLTRLLLDALRAAGSRGQGARVVTVTSATHYVAQLDPEALTGPAPWALAAYARSKLALVAFSLRLQRELEARGDDVTANMADPGVVDTALFRHADWPTRAVQRALGWLLFKTPEEGAWTSVLLAADPKLQGVGGRYLRDEEEATPLALARDPVLQERLWAEACRVTSLPVHL